MKRFSLLFVCVLIFLSAYTQDKYLKVDAGIGAGLTLGDLKSYGISASTEPKFFFTPQIAVGLRLECTMLFGGNIDAASSSFEIGISARAAQLVKGEYYFSEESTRPFVGLMTGRYVQANIGTSSAGDASIKEGSYFGFAPEIGITFNNFRLSAIYHIVPGTDLLTVTSGNPPEVSRNYLVIQLGFKVFQLDL